MKKIMTVLGVSVLAMSSPVCVMAQDHETTEEPRVHHYKGAKIESSAQGVEVLNKTILEIGDVLKNEGELEFTELEHVHELSYSLENGIDFIIEAKTAPSAQTDAVDEAVQAIHYASENGEEAKTREWFVKLKTAVDALQISEGQSATDEAAADVAPEKKEFYEIVIKDHKFSPEEIVVPSGQKIKLIIDNQDPTPEEFESHDMNREKIISGGRKATIFVGPLKPGKYHFFGEFNMDTANGYVIAK